MHLSFVKKGRKMFKVHFCSQSFELSNALFIFLLSIAQPQKKSYLPFIGKHVINLFIQYTPYDPSDGSWKDPYYRVSENFPFSMPDFLADLSLQLAKSSTFWMIIIIYPFMDRFFSQESFARRCFSLIDEYAPGFSSSVIGYDMLTPPDLEREIGLTGTAFNRSCRIYKICHYINAKFSSCFEENNSLICQLLFNCKRK